MTELNLAELDRLEREATPGEWDVELERDTDHEPPRRVESVGPLSADHDHWSGWTIGDEADALLVAAARNQLRPLLDLVGRLGAALESCGGTLHYKLCNGPGCRDECEEMSDVLDDYKRARES